MPTPERISDSTVRRLSIYLRLLRELAGEDREIVSSQELAERTGTTSAQVRKDFSLFGSFGKRGRGYEVTELIGTLEGILGLGRRWRVALVGVGRIGGALLGYRDLARQGFEIVAAFDTDPEKVGTRRGGVPVTPMAELEERVDAEGVDMGIVATPPEAAQEVADRMVEAGVEALLNFAPTKLDVPERVTVRNMDVALELEGLSFALTSRSSAVDGSREGVGTGGGAAADGGDAA